MSFWRSVKPLTAGIASVDEIRHSRWIISDRCHISSKDWWTFPPFFPPPPRESRPRGRETHIQKTRFTKYNDRKISIAWLLSPASERGTTTTRGGTEGFGEIGAPRTRQPIAAIMIIIYYYEHIHWLGPVIRRCGCRRPATLTVSGSLWRTAFSRSCSDSKCPGLWNNEKKKKVNQNTTRDRGRTTALRPRFAIGWVVMGTGGRRVRLRRVGSISVSPVRRNLRKI